MKPAQRLACVLVTLGLIVVPALARAQSATTGAIAGVVKDTTGAVLPGVTVEAASPALIEKIRTVVTDSKGEYKIVDLRPGTYTVTFSLTGFGTVKVEGIELTTGFTAAANADLKVGALQETVSVTGASPIVDVQNVRTQNVLSRDVLDAVPTGKTIQGFATMTLGAATTGVGFQDVGGNQGESAAAISIHGGRGNDMKLLVDGMLYNSNHGTGGGQMRTFLLNQVGVQEQVLETSGMNAESETGGIQMNAVPKDGGNRFTLYSNGSYTGNKLQGSNLTSELQARGVTSLPGVRKIYDYGVGVGGPVERDRLWFYSSNRWWGSQENQPGAYYNKTQGLYIGAPGSGVSLYTPDLSRPAFIDRNTADFGVRLTWQAATKHKITFSENRQTGCNCYQDTSITIAPEASSEQQYGPHYFSRGTWSYPATNRVLVEAGVAFGYFLLNTRPASDVNLPADIGITELSTNLAYNAKRQTLPVSISTSYGDNQTSNNLNGRFALSYVTGSHAFKTGLFWQKGFHNQTYYINQSLSYTFSNGLPTSLTEFISPSEDHERLTNVGLYAQDQWTVRQLTLNLGVRYDGFHAYTLAAQLPPARFIGVRNFPVVDNVPNWKDISPRIGVAYDLFGNGKTAVKASVGRYVEGMATALIAAAHPAQSLVAGASRTWTDMNGNFIPDCDLTSFTENGECGALSNKLFGTSVINRRYDPAAVTGWGNRDYNWQVATTVQHELRPGLGLNAGYFRTWYGNFTAVVNRAVTPADFDSFCVTAPVNSRLPGGGGNLICGNYDVKPAKFGQVDQLVTLASNYGAQSEVFNGFEVGFRSRFGKGGLLSGGLSTAQTVTDNCYQNALPQVTAQAYVAGMPRTAAFCHISSPWAAQTQVKFNGVYPLPGNFEVSGTIQNLPGASGPIAQSATGGYNPGANVVYTNAQIEPSLHRNLAAGVNGTATIAVVPPLVLFENRLNQVDLRLAKVLLVGRARIKGMVDLYNAFNANTVLNYNFQYGPAWLRPAQILGARLVKFGAQLDF